MNAVVSDEDLLRRHRQADQAAERRAAIDELFQRHHARVALWCLRFAGDRDRARDLAQEVFLKAYRSLGSYRGESRFTTWLYTIARNHCFNEAKARGRTPSESLGPDLADRLTDTRPDPHGELERRRRLQAAHELLNGELEENERRAMVLHYQEGLSLDAVTRLLGLTNRSGAKAYIVSARRKLQRALQRRNHAGSPAPRTGA